MDLRKNIVVSPGLIWVRMGSLMALLDTVTNYLFPVNAGEILQ
jgi:hypothetical protein